MHELALREWRATMAKLEGTQPPESALQDALSRFLQSMDAKGPGIQASAASASGSADKPASAASASGGASKPGDTQAPQDLQAEAARVNAKMAKMERDIEASKEEMAKKAELVQAQ